MLDSFLTKMFLYHHIASGKIKILFFPENATISNVSQNIEKIFFHIYNNSLKLNDFFHQVIKLWTSRLNEYQGWTIKIQENSKTWLNFRHFHIQNWIIRQKRNCTRSTIEGSLWGESFNLQIYGGFSREKNLFNVWTYLNVFKEKQYLYLPICYHIT